MPNYQQRRNLERDFQPALVALIEQHAQTLVEIRPSTETEDFGGVDLHTIGHKYGLRVRNHDAAQYGDVTFRCQTATGRPTEWHRIQDGTMPDRYVYAICDETQTNLTHWWIINMWPIQREHRTIDRSYSSNYDGTAFYGIPINTLHEHDAIIASHQPTANQLPLL